MITVEVVMKMSLITVGPFDNQREAMDWVSELITANPNEKAVIAVNETSSSRIRVYVSGNDDEEFSAADFAPELRFTP